MNAPRSERVTVNLDPDLLAKLDRFAAERHWTRSTAIAVLVEQGLGRGIDHSTPFSEGGSNTRRNLRSKDNPAGEA